MNRKSSHTQQRKGLRATRLFWGVSLALLLVFGLAQIHELIPFLHNHDHENVPGDSCPFCIIKHVLMYAVALFVLWCTAPGVSRKVFLPGHTFRRFVIAISLSARAPPQFSLA